MHSAPQNLAVTNAIIGLGHTLGLQVVAEGVEREADVELLRAAGCDELQGFYFARPMPQAQLHGMAGAQRRALRRLTPPVERPQRARGFDNAQCAARAHECCRDTGIGIDIAKEVICGAKSSPLPCFLSKFQLWRRLPRHSQHN